MRKVNLGIIHCSATHEGVNISVETIRDWHKRRGFNDIGYHYIIGIDGVLFDGRSVEEVGAHCIGYNSNSVGICYIGGLNKHGDPKDTRTEAQKATMIKLMNNLKLIFPGIEFHGHNEYSSKACPCFNVPEWLKEINFE